ncbi:MAG: nicotinate-nucleotide adenylyltransferase [Legionella sp.]|nr:nicotinate-nucleotide adenylyltransferase [Legionella sp.]
MMKKNADSIHPRNLIIFGGTFDPIHNGHLYIASQVQEKFAFDRFVFLPCKTPLLKKSALASSKQRVEMIKRSIIDQPSCFYVDDMEIRRRTPSYTVETLNTFRKRYGPMIPITLLLGVDTFLQLPQWHEWQKILDLANLCVVNRPNTKPQADWSASVNALLLKHETKNSESLLQTPSGLIYRFNAGSFYISSTAIRAEFARGNIPIDSLPHNVVDYIHAHKLYLSKL